MDDEGGRLRVLVPRLLDAGNTNAQNLNAKALLARFRRPNVDWLGLHYDAPDPEVAANPQVRLSRLWRRHLWPWHALFQYQERVDAVFYPGGEWFDEAGLKWRDRLGRRVPVIATLEGLAGDADTEKVLSGAAGHAVHCHRVERRVLERARAVLDRADHVIAISPFLARMGRVLHGDKFSVLPLGLDTTTFYPPAVPKPLRRPLIVSAGRVASHKRPQVFLELARRFPYALFKWFGEGADRRTLIAEARERRLVNVDFPGARIPAELAEEFRKADILVLPAQSEGAPKVAQEAAGCGLPVVAFGFYEPPSVADGANGYLVWNDDEMFARVEQLIGDLGMAEDMGRLGATLAGNWSWNIVASLWEAELLHAIRSGMMAI